MINRYFAADYLHLPHIYWQYPIEYRLFLQHALFVQLELFLPAILPILLPKL
jgi:hypothetical protein